MGQNGIVNSHPNIDANLRGKRWDNWGHDRSRQEEQLFHERYSQISVDETIRHHARRKKSGERIIILPPTEKGEIWIGAPK